MLTVVLGAGASYDSVTHRPPGNLVDSDRRPPLTRDLFSARGSFGQAIDMYPAVRPLAHHFRGLPADAPFEEALDALLAESETYPRLKQQLAALRFYLQRIIWQTAHEWTVNSNGVTNYRALLDRIDRWRYPRDERVCVINFNYDLLMDDAFDVVGLPMRTPEDFSIHPEYTYLKPHGSVNWVRPVLGARIPSPRGHGMVIDLIQLIDQAGQPGDIKTINNASDVENEPCIPALMIPLQTKAAFEMPSGHLPTLERCLRETDRLLVIGWRATEKHFLELAARMGPSVTAGLVVRGGRAGAEQTATVLREYGIASIGVSELGFSAFLASRELEEMLS